MDEPRRCVTRSETHFGRFPRISGLRVEYFLGKFAMSEGQKGGEFFTPTSIVKLIVEIIEPFHGRVYDPAYGSGGMFVQSAAFVERHKKNPTSELSIYGQEKTEETIRLCKMNLAFTVYPAISKTATPTTWTDTAAWTSSIS